MLRGPALAFESETDIRSKSIIAIGLKALLAGSYNCAGQAEQSLVDCWEHSRSSLRPTGTALDSS